jgi:pyruvate dehydrogenase (quinone)
MARIASEALIERLADWGVDTVFCMPGEGISGIVEGLRRHQDRVRFVQAPGEEAAARLASGYARATGRIGVCLATPGPGDLHLLNGLHDATLDHAPVLAITGLPDQLYADVTCYDQTILDPLQIPEVTDLAVRTAYARFGVAHIAVPDGIQVAAADPGDAGPDELPRPGQRPAQRLGRQSGRRFDRRPGRRLGQPRRAAIPTTLLRGRIQPPRS